MDKKKLKEVAKELKGASKMHAGQAKKIESAVKYTSPFKMSGFPHHAGTSPLNKKGPCWKGYEMIGTKKKGGRTVPNCVPKK